MADGRRLEKIEKSSSAVVPAIFTKFDMITQFDLLYRPDR